MPFCQEGIGKKSLIPPPVRDQVSSVNEDPDTFSIVVLPYAATQGSEARPINTALRGLIFRR